MTNTVDPWAMQHALMAASDQHLPEQYELHPGVLLYAALNLEELAESLHGVQSALAKAPGQASHTLALATLFKESAEMMTQHSRAIRALLEQVPASTVWPMEKSDLREMADGATDLTVTNSGFTLALGLPGPALYEEVASSNLSKKNPETGKIDKLPDGKWIKGVEYRKPDIDKVLFG
jgi:hypothetical protein